MKIILLHNHYSEEHLEEVMKEMKTKGAPVIRVYDLWDDMVQAIEGCHRLRACDILGIEPIIEYIDDDTKIEDLGLDYEGCAEVVGELGDWENNYILI